MIFTNTIPSLLRAARLAALVMTVALCAQDQWAQAQTSEGAPDLRSAPVWTSVSASAGGAFGSDRDFFYSRITIPFAIGEHWAVGPSAAAYFQADQGGGSTSDNSLANDRGTVGLEVRRTFGRVTFEDLASQREAASVDRVAFYVGARGAYGFAEGRGDGLYGGITSGVQYQPNRDVALGLEAGVTFAPDETLFVPLGTFSVNL